MRVSCSIVCYENSVTQVSRVLSSIAACPMRMRLYLIDNSATARLGDVARQFGARYAHLPSNPGFGRAHNMAIRDALAHGIDYHLVLNPDIYFSSHVLPAMLDYMERHVEVGLLSPRVQYPDGLLQHLCKLLPNPVDLIIRRFLPFLHRITGRMAHYELHRSGYDKVMDVPALSGCFMLMRASVIRHTGAFDERFFLYFEDIDLTRRIGAVARTVYFPYVSIVHEYTRGSYRDLKLLRCHLLSAIRYFNKWGWFFDAGRRKINRASIKRLRKIN